LSWRSVGTALRVLASFLFIGACKAVCLLEMPVTPQLALFRVLEAGEESKAGGDRRSRRLGQDGSRPRGNQTSANTRPPNAGARVQFHGAPFAPAAVHDIKPLASQRLPKRAVSTGACPVCP